MLTDSQIRKMAEKAGLSQANQMRFMKFAHLCWRTGKCAARIKIIAALFSVRERQAQNILALLRRKGLITVRRRFIIVAGQARQISNIYAIVPNLLVAVFNAGRQAIDMAREARRRVVRCRLVIQEHVPEVKELKPENDPQYWRDYYRLNYGAL